MSLLINKLKKSRHVIFYDSYCYLCSNTVRLLLWLDKKKKLKFLNTEIANSDTEIRKIISVYQINDSILFYSDKKFYTQSDAIIEISKTLGGGFKLFHILYVFPRSIRDSIYRFVARNRYKMFGKRKKCHVLGAEFTDRYL